MASKQIEDTYPLSPTQQGMLFHTLYAPHSGIYVEQLRCMLRGDLDAAAFERAWQQVVDRHPALRSAFAWKRLARPLQVVGRRVTVPLRRLDWRELPPAEQQTRLEAYCEEDRRRGLELSRAPLLRVALIQLADDAFYFVWTVHHMLLDGWSTALVLKEVFALYAALRRGEAPQLEAIRPYREYIAWLQAQDPAAAKAFWRRTLGGFTTPTPLGIDRPAALHDQPPQPAKQHLELAAEETAALLARARQQTLTLNTLILGAWALLLSRYSGVEDLVFGATVSGRPPELPGVQSMVGLFISTVPVRVRVPPAAPLLAWLQELQDQQAEARQYAHSPLTEIQGWSAVPRGQPLFESIVVFENYPAATALAAAGAQVDLAITDVRTADQNNYPLALVVVPGQSLRVQISYDRRRFEDATIGRMLRHIHTLISGIVVTPDGRLGDLPILTDAERQQLLLEWNGLGGREQGTGERTIQGLFAEQAARTPDAVATSLDERRTTKDERRPTADCRLHLTYAELDRRANQLAHHLRALGVGPDTPVGVCLERSPEMIVALLGVLKAGGAYLPLDPSYPSERISFMLEDSGAAVLITTNDIRCPEGVQTNDQIEHLVTLSPCHLVDLETDWPLIARQPETNPDSGAAPDNLAYIMYTSGSTGQPKGVSIPHRAVARLIKGARYARLTADQIFLQFAPLAFDASTFEVWGSLLNGARLVVFPAHAPALAELGRALCQERITVLWITAGLFAQMVERHPDSLRQIAQVLTGGDVVSQPHMRMLLQQPGERTLIHAYGPTENTTFTSCHPLRNPADLARSAAIGRPIAHTQVYLLDRRLRPVPIGVPGELYTGGAGLARGYLNRPDLTAAAFVPNPFAEVSGIGYRVSEDSAPNTQHPTPNTRLYKTGDMARYREDGAIEFLGRIDQQVKLRGFRIEPGEIEAALAQHPSVRAAVVVAREDAGDKRLVAYIVEGSGVEDQGSGKGRTTNDKRRMTNDERRTTNDDRPSTIDDQMCSAPWSIVHRPSSSNDESGPWSIVHRPSSLIDELRGFLSERLPDYMLPSAFVALDELPLTANGKVDRAALPAPDRLRPEREAGFVAPRTPVEKSIAAVWAEVLGLERVGVEDTFFALGGHSLLAAHMADRLNETFLTDLPLRELLEAPTVAGMARLVERITAEAAGDATMDRLLAAVEGLSADEVQALLADEQTRGRAI